MKGEVERVGAGQAHQSPAPLSWLPSAVRLKVAVVTLARNCHLFCFETVVQRQLCETVQDGGKDGEPVQSLHLQSQRWGLSDPSYGRGDPSVERQLAGLGPPSPSLCSLLTTGAEGTSLSGDTWSQEK